MPKNSLSSHFTRNVSACSLLNATGTLSAIIFYGQMKLNLSFSAMNTQGMYGGGSVRFWGCFFSKGPGNLVRINGIIKYQDIFHLNLAASARKLKLIVAHVVLSKIIIS